MTQLTGNLVADTFKSLLKTVDNDVLSAYGKEIVDGYGNSSNILINTSGDVTINGNFRALDAILDSSGSAGTNGQVLVTTGLKTEWKSLSAVSGVSGTGTAGYITKWLDANTITNSIIIESGTTVTIGGTLVVNTKIQTPLLQLTGGTGTQGEMSWNADEETLDLINNGAVLQLGQEIHIHVRNNSATTAIPNGTPVYVAGTLGASGRLKVAPMIADGSISPEYFIGVTTEEIEADGDGKVTFFGKVRGFDTSIYNEGDKLYVSETVAGGWQTTHPVAPNPKLEVAIAVNSTNNGTIFVRSQTGYNLDDIHDIEITSASNGDLLVYNSTDGIWENSSTITASYLRFTGDVDIDGDLNIDGGDLTSNATGFNLLNSNVTTVNAFGAATQINMGVGTGKLYMSGDIEVTGKLKGPASFYIDPSPDDTYGDATTDTGKVVILGDLEVTGTTTTVDSTVVNIADLNITLASNAATASQANGAGITINGANATLTYASATDDFHFNKTVNAGTFIGALTGNVTGNADTATSAGKWTTARTITLGGDLTGNVSIDGSANVTLTAAVVDDSHNHDGRYYTETEADGKFLLNTTDTLTGNLTITANLTVDTDTFYVDSTNNKIGIGTTTLGNRKLEIKPSQNLDLSTGGDDTGGILIKGGVPSNGNYTGGLGFAFGTGTAGISGVQDSTDSDRIGLMFYTHNSSTGNDPSTEMARFTSAGLFGLGTDDPSAHIELSGTGTGAAIDWTNTTATTGRSYRWVSLNTGGFAVEDMTASGAERLRIDSDGYVTFTNPNGIVLDGNGSTPDTTTGTYNQGLTIEGGNMRLNIDTSNVTNGGAYIQTRHESDTYPSATYTLALNPLGGNVTVNNNTILHTGNFDITNYTDPKYLRSDESDTLQSAVNGDLSLTIYNTYDDDLATSNPNALLWLAAASNNGYFRVHGAPTDLASDHQIDIGSSAGDSYLTFTLGTEKLRLENDGDLILKAGDLVFDGLNKHKIMFHSEVNSGSDKAFIYFNDNSTFHRTGTENVRLSIGAYNDFSNSSVHSDAVDIQGGSRLFLNAGDWDAELDTEIGTPATGAYLDAEPIQFAVNNVKAVSVTSDGYLKVHNNLIVSGTTSLQSMSMAGSLTVSSADVSFSGTSNTSTFSQSNVFNGSATFNDDITLNHSATGQSVNGITITDTDNSYTGVLSVQSGNKLAWNGYALITTLTAGAYVSTGPSGDTMEGNLTISNTAPLLYLKDSNSTGATDSYGQVKWYDSTNAELAAVGFYGADSKFYIDAQGSNVYIPDDLEIGSQIHLPDTHAKDKIVVFKGGSEWIGTSSGHLELSGTNINFNGAAGSGNPNIKHNGTLIMDTSRNMSNIGTISASSFIKSGGASSQFLKADGSVDSNSYLTTTGKAADSNLLDGIDSTGFIRDLGDVTVTNFDNLADGWLGSNETTATNQPYANHHNTFTITNDASAGRKTQLFFADSPGGGFHYRVRQGDTVGWHDWEKVITDVNYGGLLDSYYLRSDTSDTMNGSLTVKNGSSGAGSSWTNADELIIENSANVGLTLKSPNTSAATIAFQDPESVQAGFIQYLHASNDLRFATNGNNIRMTIDDSGNLMVNTDNPLVADSATETGLVLGGQRNLLHVSRSGADAARFNRLASDGRILSFSRDGTDKGGFGVNGNSIYVENISGGSLGVNTTSPDSNYKLHVNGSTRIEGTGNALVFDTTGGVGSNGIKSINNYETVIFNGRGSAGFAVIGNSSIRLGFGSSYTAAQSDLYIDSDGNVSIGTSDNDVYKFRVLGSTRSDGDIYAVNKIVTNNGYGLWLNSPTDANWKVGRNVAGYSSTCLYATGSTLDLQAHYTGGQGITFGRNGGNSSFEIEHTSTTAAQFMMRGDLDIQNPLGYGLISRADPYHGICLRGYPTTYNTLAMTAGDYMSFFEYGADFRFYKKNSSGTLALQGQLIEGTWRVTGDVVAYYSFSDARLKTNVKPLENSLDKVKQLQGVSYQWIDGERKGKTEVGLIAQEVEKVVPEVVREQQRIDDETQYKTVDYEKLVGVLIEAIKEQQEQIDELKKLINK